MPFDYSAEQAPSRFSSFFKLEPGSTSMAEMVLPAVADSARRSETTPGQGMVHNRGTIETKDGAKLASIIIHPQSDPQDAMHIVQFNGNGQQFEPLVSEHENLATHLGAVVHAFDYRGVGNSTPKPSKYQQLVEDGIAQVQYLIVSGVPAHRIILCGHSLGGSVATKVAAHYHKNGSTIALFNGRSFATVTKAACGMLLSDKASSVTKAVVGSSVASVMSMTGWSIDVVNDYISLPEASKMCLAVAPPSDVSQGDGVIAHEASLYHALEKKGLHALAVLVRSPSRPGHNVPLSWLDAGNGRTGADVFETFVQQQCHLAQAVDPAGVSSVDDRSDRCAMM